MEAINISNSQISPVAIGGVGGSGTRLIANCLEELNYHIGSDLNKAKDNLWFTLLFKHIDILDYNDEQLKDLLNIFLQGMLTDKPLSEAHISAVNELVHDNRHLPKEFFEERAASLTLSHNNAKKFTNWGWKEPNTHIILDRLISYMPNMKYIHVMRNGLDMAHSANQNQQFLWGKKFVGDHFKQTPYYSLKYWCIVHQRLLKIAKPMGNHFLLLNFDDFCSNPELEIPKLLDFLGAPSDDTMIEKFSSLIKAPASIGRYKEFGTDIFDQDDLCFVESLGFST
jgi:hypothetical protein